MSMVNDNSNLLVPKALKRIRSEVRAMHAYAVQNAQGMIKLDAMENPYTLPLDLQEKLGKRLGTLALNRYPYDNVQTLKTALKKYLKVPEDYELLVSNGSDEVIALLAQACSRVSDRQIATVLSPSPSFVMYNLSAQLNHMSFVGVDLLPDFELDVQAMCHAMEQHDPALVYLAYPNNPTANLWSEEGVLSVVEKAAQMGTIVVMDEAYQPFANKTFLDVVKRAPEHFAHVLIMGTLSKFGLAGVRLGYVMGVQALVSEIDKVRPPYNVSVLNAQAALFALENADIFREQAKAICAERARVIHAIDTQVFVSKGVRVFDSAANIILIRVPDAQKVFEALKEQKILVKNMHGTHSLLAQCLRLTVGAKEENDALLHVLGQNLQIS